MNQPSNSKLNPNQIIYYEVGKENLMSTEKEILITCYKFNKKQTLMIVLLYISTHEIRCSFLSCSPDLHTKLTLNNPWTWA